MTPDNKNTECAWARDNIDLYVDDDLTTEDAVRLERHLNRCDACRDEVALAARVLEELRGLPDRRCPDGIVDDVFASIGAPRTAPAEPRARRRLPAWPALVRHPALAATLAIVVLTGGALLGRWYQTRNRISPEEIARAEAALKWTVAYVSDVGRRASFTVRDDVIGGHVVGPLRSGVHNATTDDDKSTHEQNNGG